MFNIEYKDVFLPQENYFVIEEITAMIDGMLTRE
jgi:hypothetical protein